MINQVQKQVIFVTEREFEKLRNYEREPSGRYEKDEVTRDGYFAFFKLRCLICLVLFLGLVAVDKQVNIRENDRVMQAVNLLNRENFTWEECMGFLQKEFPAQ